MLNWVIDHDLSNL